MNSLGMLGGMFGGAQSGFGGGVPGMEYEGWGAFSKPSNNGGRVGGSLLMPWLFGDPRAAGILNQPANFWTGNGSIRPRTGGGGGGGSSGGGGGGSSPPPAPPPQWEYPDLLEAQYLTTNWFGK